MPHLGGRGKGLAFTLSVMRSVQRFEKESDDVAIVLKGPSSCCYVENN